MIVDVLDRGSRYAPTGSRLEAAFRWLAGFDPATPDGRHELDGARLFALVQRYDTQPATGRRFESHRRYADVQYVAAGRERLLHAPAEGLDPDVPYRAEDDVAFYHDPPASSSVLLRRGDFAVLYPEDAHKPGCMAGGREPVLKVVVKVEL